MSEVFIMAVKNNDSNVVYDPTVPAKFQSLLVTELLWKRKNPIFPATLSCRQMKHSEQKI